MDHKILTTRLQNRFGLGGTVLLWIQSFLTGRYHQVKLGLFRAAKTQGQWGVPQGSALSQFLFNSYMRPLPDIIISYELQCQLYADDTQILVDTSESPSQAQCLADCLTHVQEWMSSNWLGLGLNISKTEVLLVGKNIPPL